MNISVLNPNKDPIRDKFAWLYIDYNTLSLLAAVNGFNCEKVMEGDHYDYLARLTVK